MQWFIGFYSELLRNVIAALFRQFNTTSHFAICYRNDTEPLDTRVNNTEHPELPRLDHKPNHISLLPTSEGFLSFKATVTLHMCALTLYIQ